MCKEFEYERYTPIASINETQYQQILNMITKIVFADAIYPRTFDLNDFKERKKIFIKKINAKLIEKHVPDLDKYLDPKDYNTYADLVYKVYDKWWERSNDELMSLLPDY